MGEYDVVVVGAGNAAMAAALTARQHGANVVVLEAADPDNAGGNTRYAAGQTRTTYRGVEDLLEIVPDLTREEIASSDFGEYRREHFLEDVGRLTQYRCNPELVETLVDSSHATLKWMREQGVRFQASYGRQAVKVDGRYKFWGGLPCEIWGGGPGLLEAYYLAAAKAGIEIRHHAHALELILESRRVVGVRCASRGNTFDVRAKAVVLACGGFEANAEMRARYLGPNWDLAKVRGTKFNTGQGLKMALDIGASAAGHWSGAHSTCWDLNSPETGNLRVGDGYQKFSYPIGVMINARGERFVDEGADLQVYTYSRIGREILAQPGMLAWQVFDQRAVPLLLREYRIREVTKVTAPTLEALAAKLEGVDAKAFLKTMEAYNASVPHGEPQINISVRDGRATRGLALPKSNWAYRIDRGPFEAYAVTTGITFTFGGLRITPRAQVVDAAWEPIQGLYAAGEIVGGLFFNGYPGGTGLVSGAVFGRIAGREAALREASAENASEENPRFPAETCLPASVRTTLDKRE